MTTHTHTEAREGILAQIFTDGKRLRHALCEGEGVPIVPAPYRPGDGEEWQQLEAEGWLYAYRYKLHPAEGGRMVYAVLYANLGEAEPGTGRPLVSLAQLKEAAQRGRLLQVRHGYATEVLPHTWRPKVTGWRTKRVCWVQTNAIAMDEGGPLVVEVSNARRNGSWYYWPAAKACKPMPGGALRVYHMHEGKLDPAHWVEFRLV